MRMALQLLLPFILAACAQNTRLFDEPYGFQLDFISKGAVETEATNLEFQPLSSYDNRQNGWNYETFTWKEKPYRLLIYKHSRWGCTTNKLCGLAVPYESSESFRGCSFTIESESSRGQWEFGVRAVSGSNKRFEWAYRARRRSTHITNNSSLHLHSRSYVYTRGEMVWLDVNAPDELRRELCAIPLDGAAYTKTKSADFGWNIRPEQPWGAASAH